MRFTIKLMLILAAISAPAVAANLSVPGQFATIQEAVDASSPGDRILVGAGPHDGAEINTRVQIIGEGDATIIVHGPHNPIGDFLYFQNGFQIVAGGDGTILRDMRVDLDPSFVDPEDRALHQVGIFSISASSVSVRGLTFVGLHTGVDHRDGDKWSVTNNSIEGLVAHRFRRAIGIRMQNTSGSFIGFNTVTHDGTADDNSSLRFRGIELLCTFCGDPVENNKLIENEIDIDATNALELSDIQLWDGSAISGESVEVINNKIVNNDADPIVFVPPEVVGYNLLK